jgi:thiamine biosynthesis lipoprotein
MMRRAQPWLGTLVEITIADEGGAPIQQAIDLAFSRIRLVHELMSFHDARSDVSRINRAAPASMITVDAHTYQVLQIAEEIRAASEGLFNIDCGAKLVDWDYLPAPDGKRPVSKSEEPLLRLLEPDRVVKAGEGWIDLGGIAKGYAVDLAAQALEAAGIGSACINAGGDLRVIGDTGYPVLIRSPLDCSPQGRRIALSDGALATSGIYFSRKPRGGQWVSALIDGRSGQPLATPISASVRASRCVIADALTKVLIATNNPGHPALAKYQASGFII